ncbi:hypothetical protein R3O67_31920 [Bacillus cereus]|uniref:hypothetical protein n=1 Tax=Bacillus cereus TaxID=1396 RepID=UPI00307A7904
MKDEIKKRITYLNTRIENLESREKEYKEPLTKFGHIEVGRIRGSIISKEMEIAFLTSLLQDAIKKPLF